MADKKKKAKTPKDLPKRKLTSAQLGKVKGGMMKMDDQCKETDDSGTHGCPG
jgi:hypothetical protein